MSLSILDALSKSGSASTVPQAADKGLQPNKFELQMFGPNATVGQRPSIGFGSPALRDQIPPGAMPKPVTQPGPLPGANPAADPWASMGPAGMFLKMIDGLRTKNGMPSLMENEKMMSAFRSSAQNPQPDNFGN